MYNGALIGVERAGQAGVKAEIYFFALKIKQFLSRLFLSGLANERPSYYFTNMDTAGRPA